MRLTIISLCLFFLSGCATIVNDANIPITVSFSDGSEGECKFRNKRGFWKTDVPDTVYIRRSDDQLLYECETSSGYEPEGAIVSEMEGEKLGASVLFFDFGITDAITDMHRTYQANIVIPVKTKKSNWRLKKEKAEAETDTDDSEG
jgi:hypothetical protein